MKKLDRIKHEFSKEKLEERIIRGILLGAVMTVLTKNDELKAPVFLTAVSSYVVADTVAQTIIEAIY